MAQNVLTTAFKNYLAEQTANKQTVEFDKIIFANISGLTAESVAKQQTVPSKSQIKHTADIQQTSYINKDEVVYSVTLGTEIGDFAFNFVGLINSKKNLLAMGVYTGGMITKSKTKDSEQGNALTRNMILKFANAKDLTGITSSAEAWQFDFTDYFLKIPPQKITANTKNTADKNGHTHEIDKASTTTAGVVQLVDNYTSSDTNKALTARAGKSIYDTLKGILDGINTAMTKKVNQGGGSGQGTNNVYIGWSGSRLKGQVDSTDLGNFVFDDQLNNTARDLRNQIQNTSNDLRGQLQNTSNDLNRRVTDAENDLTNRVNQAKNSFSNELNSTRRIVEEKTSVLSTLWEGWHGMQDDTASYRVTYPRYNLNGGIENGSFDTKKSALTVSLPSDHANGIIYLEFVATAGGGNSMTKRCMSFPAWYEGFTGLDRYGGENSDRNYATVIYVKRNGRNITFYPKAGDRFAGITKVSFLKVG